MKTRLGENLKIVDLLTRYLNEHPELRFIQALWALGIISSKPSNNVNNVYGIDVEDRFHEESKATLEKLEQELLHD